MRLDQIDDALDSLRNWPAKIGIIGGEPLLHPDFITICKLVRSKFLKKKMCLFTSGGKRLKEYRSEIRRTFGLVVVNEHNAEQQEECRHQPLTLAIKDMVPDPRLRKALIDDCWVQRIWSPTINRYGAYFCEVAAAQDALLNDGRNAWPITPWWWARTPEMFQDQVNLFCDNCGMALPTERDPIKNRREKFSPSLFYLFRKRGLARVSDKDIELVTRTLPRKELIENIKHWYPGNYREDRNSDCECAEGRGFRGELK